ncbi:beta-1,6-glucan synthase [Acidocella aquatica]|uniref:Endo-1,3-beta-glucanase btgC n=1 Tax=Acidocella aquatica TaxID=1922313 RepID=A0ABQ6A8Q9_9PROT|nr:glycoside hydrolase [Acidocella aquatica]GLR66524.1 beta-1,6-glucan synthase [Acidocella aquatica]
MKKSLFACLALSLLTFLLWKAPNQPQAGDVTMTSGKFNSLSYAPYRSWQSPQDKTYPTTAEISQDLALVATHAEGIRTYSSVEGTLPTTLAAIRNGTDIVGLAQKAGLKVWLGIWLSSNPADNAKEIAAGVAEASAYPSTVTRVVVGNEVLLRRDLPVDGLIADIDAVRAQVKQPVAYADVTDFWKQFPQVAPHVNIVMIHFLPYWENTPLSVDAAIASIKSTTDEFKALFPGKQISIGETGWPSRGRARGAAVPSRVNEAVFLRKFVTLANQEGVDYNLIEAFDQPWKYEDEGVAGANWGIWNTNRIQKFPLNGPVVEHPGWPWYALLAALSGCLLFWAAGFKNLRLAVAAFALGNGFAIACIGTLPMLYDNWLRLDALVNLPLQAAFAVLAIRRAGAVLSGAALPPVAAGAQTLAALRRGKFALTYDSLWFIFLASAAIFEVMLVFGGRYRDAPMPVFIIPVIAAAIRLWTRDKPQKISWEEILAANTLAIFAVLDTLIEGGNNLDFVAWSIAALVMAAPVILAQEGKRAVRKGKLK